MKTCPLLFILALHIIFTDGRFFRNDYKYEPSLAGWVKLHLMPEKWEEARLRCLLEGSTLATPLNDDSKGIMKNTMGTSVKQIFTGVSAIYSGGDFFSVEGFPLERMSKTWAPNEPNNSGDERCIAMNEDGALADVSCIKPLPYICFRKDQHTTIVNQCGTVDPEYVLEARTGQCYKFHRFGQSWSKAFMTCSAEGGHLAIINNEVEAQVLRELMAKNPGGKILAKHRDYIGIGFRDWSEHGVFMTVHGQSLQEAGYDKWSGGQPDNFTTGEYCGSMFRNALLNDIWCQDTLPFICEKEPGSLLETTGCGAASELNDQLTQNRVLCDNRQ